MYTVFDIILSLRTKKLYTYYSKILKEEHVKTTYNMINMEAVPVTCTFSMFLLLCHLVSHFHIVCNFQR